MRAARGDVRFYLGTHRPHWLGLLDVPLFVSRRQLAGRRTMPRALGPWAMDSGGFTELSLNGRWTTTPEQYVADVRRIRDEVGNLEWVAPQDWMCEPHMLDLTGFDVPTHQRLTVDNFLRLRDSLGPLVVPVLQGWEPDDYHRCVDLYDRAGVDLAAEPVVGVGTVCRRQDTATAGTIFRGLARLGLSLHGFGVKATGLSLYAEALASADSLAWSLAGRRRRMLRDCTHSTCANCMPWALRWREQTILNRLAQQPLWRDTA